MWRHWWQQNLHRCNINMQLINVQLCCETTVFHVFSPLDVRSARYVTRLELNIDCLHARCICASAFIKSAFQIIIRDRFREATLFQPSVQCWVTPKRLHMSAPLKMNSKVRQYPTLPRVRSCVATMQFKTIKTSPRMPTN